MELKYYDIPNWPGYMINMFGDVMSVKNIKRYPSGCMLKVALSNSGYKCVFFKIKNKQYIQYIHRLLAITFIKNEQNKKEVNHKDGNKLNNSLENLEWVTPSENQKHSYKNGLNKGTIGEKNYWASLKDEDVLKIRELYATGKYKQSELANMFMVNVGVISGIVRAAYWKHIGGVAIKKSPKKIVLDLNTGIFYESAKEVCALLGKHYVNVCRLIKRGDTNFIYV